MVLHDNHEGTRDGNCDVPGPKVSRETIGLAQSIQRVRVTEKVARKINVACGPMILLESIAC